jgi:hypothetical protein
MALSFIASAEIHTIDQKFGGIACDSCAVSLEKAFGRMRDVESAEIRSGDGVARLHLKSGNRISLETIRDRIKGAGFTPGEARITATGTFSKADGNWEIRFVEGGLLYPVRASGEQLKQIGDGYQRRIEAVVAAQTDPRSAPAVKIESISQ